MAIYHLSLKIGAKGKAAPHFNYICASSKYDKKQGVEHVEHGNMPIWAMADPALFWQASDEFERANGTAYRELEVSLPRELPPSQQVELARSLAEEACGHNHAFTFAIHHAKASDSGMNPHVHLQFSERIDDGIERDCKHYFKRANKKQPEKGGCVKDRAWQASTRGRQKCGAASSERLLAIRQSWEAMCNQALADANAPARIDCRSYADQDITLTPQPKVGAKSWHQQKRTGHKNERFKRWEQIVQSNQPILVDMARVCRDTLESHHAALLDEQTFVRDELNKLREAKPAMHSQEQIIRQLVPDTKRGKAGQAAITHAQQVKLKAERRHRHYMQVMDTPLSFGNLGKKLAYWWKHGSRSTEAGYVRETESALKKAQRKYDALLAKAQESPSLIIKAVGLLEVEQQEYQAWQDNISAMERRLAVLDDRLQVDQGEL
ncbi:MobA/MobL family protein, partial [Mariprofundus sp. EBB-1]|uniref:MobA/MobL family protein n=1 Tax=Mariprofundus sp. EBB-1 TaxID=2650971 RepID=UPI000EF1EB16